MTAADTRNPIIYVTDFLSQHFLRFASGLYPDFSYPLWFSFPNKNLEVCVTLANHNFGMNISDAWIDRYADLLFRDSRVFSDIRVRLIVQTADLGPILRGVFACLLKSDLKHAIPVNGICVLPSTYYIHTSKSRI